MVSNVGLNLNNSYGTNNITSGNLFNFNSLQPVNTDYEDDMFMPDYLKTKSLTFSANNQSQNQVQNTVNQQTQPSSVFTATKNETANIEQMQLPQLPQDEEPKKSNIFKIIGATLGLTSPAIAAYASKAPVVWKSLALKVPLFGIAGYAIGAIADQIFGQKKTQETNNAIGR